MPTPLLSVILPNYNHAAFLPRCLDAILGQSFRDLELIVVDDGSADESRAVLEAYARRDRRVRVYRNDRNRGVAYTLNRALGLAAGAYVFGAASDDYILPGYFAAAMEMLQKHPRAGVCLGLTRCENDRGQVVAIVPGEWADRPGYLTPGDLAPRMTGCGIPGPSVWRRDAFLEAGAYNPDLRWHCDWFALQVVGFRHGVCFLPEMYAVVRMADESYSNGQHQDPQVQRRVLHSLLRLLRSAAYRDVLPLFARSGILRQFGPALATAAVTLDGPTDDLVACLKPHVLPHIPGLLRDGAAGVRAGAAGFLGRCGRDGLGYDRELVAVARDPVPTVAAAASVAWSSVLRSVPAHVRWRHRARRVLGRLIRTIDRFARPLLHDRLERQEELMAGMFPRNAELLAGIIGQLGELTAQVEQLRDEVARWRADARHAGRAPRSAARRKAGTGAAAHG